MKTLPFTLSAAAALVLGIMPASATIYTDATGDFTGGNSDLDIASVGVNNDGSSLTFTINLAGNPSNGNWYNYYVGISKNLFGGVGGNLNASGGWGKDIQMSSGGMDFFLGSFPFYAGSSLLTWNGSAWTTTSGTASENTTSVTIPVSLAALGLSAGNSFTFDVWASDSGADTVLDALSDGTARSWNGNAFDTGANALSYTVVAPEPGTMVLAGMGLMLAFLRSRGSARQS